MSWNRLKNLAMPFLPEQNLGRLCYESNIDSAIVRFWWFEIEGPFDGKALFIYTVMCADPAELNTPVTDFATEHYRFLFIN